jgi:hypothetical protein
MSRNSWDTRRLTGSIRQDPNSCEISRLSLRPAILITMSRNLLLESAYQSLVMSWGAAPRRCGLEKTALWLAWVAADDGGAAVDAAVS